jgi:hypothetical protein
VDEDDDILARVTKAKKASPFLKTKEAAFYLGLHPRTLVRMRKERRGPEFRRHGRYIFYHIDDLLAWSKGPKQ